jgi:microcystin-dependent protein
MSYTVNFTDQTNNGNITVNDNTINTATSLGFPGRNQKGYAVTVAENFLHLLENFAKMTPPSNPIEGQLWYDTSPGIESLKVYDGTNWKSSGSVKKGSSQPDIGGSILGDIWVDTANQQLYLYNGANWILVGPTFSSGLQTGAKPEKIKDSTTAQTEHIVLMNYVDDRVVSILSNSEFTPQSGISGFENIKVGVNLSSNSNKFWGVSEKAENLIIGGSIIPAANFLRADVPNITTKILTVKSDSGLNVGGDSQLQLRITEQTGVLYYSTPGSRFDIRLNVGSGTHVETTLISLDATSGRIGIGLNNLAPAETLSVKGTGSFTEQVKITDTTDTINVATGALIIDGGTVIKKKLRVSGEISASSTINSSNILPITNNTVDIGSVDLVTPSNNKIYRNVYATTFNGSLIGNVTGSVVGSVTGTASSLISSTVFRMTGDVTSSGFSFDGSATLVSSGAFVTGQQYKITSLARIDPITKAPINPTDFTLIGASSNTIGLIFTATGVGLGTGTATTSTDKVFTTQISPEFITNQNPTTVTANTDEIIINRPFVEGGDPSGVYKTTKKDFVSNLPVVPVGAIFPFAGAAIPPGYLLCDGSEKLIGVYQDLYNVIGYIYTPNTNSLVGSGTFKIPDLRGRFPLGLDNMDNGDKVPDKTVTNTISLIDSGGGPAGRVNASTASVLGQVAGQEQVTLDITQMPDHKHDLSGSTGGQYYAINNTSVVPTDEDAFLGKGPTGANQSQYISTTGNIKTNQPIGNAVSLMNPYMAINYIIYSGVII